MVEDFKEAASPVESDGYAIAVPISFKEHYSGSRYDYRQEKIADTDISFIEGSAAMATAALAGVAGSAFNKRYRGKVGEVTAAVAERHEGDLGNAYRGVKESYLAALPTRFMEGNALPAEDVGTLVMMDDADIGQLPFWMQADVYQAQRDVALATVYLNDSRNRTGITPQGDAAIHALAPEERAATYKTQRDRVTREIEDIFDLPQEEVSYSGPVGASAGFPLGLVAGSMLAGNNNNNGGGGNPVAAGAGAAILIMGGAVIVGGSMYLSGKSVYDNFIAANPDKIELDDAGKPKLLSAQADLEDARKILKREGVMPTRAPVVVAAGPNISVPGPA